MIVNYDLIHSDNIYLVNNGKIKVKYLLVLIRLA